MATSTAASNPNAPWLIMLYMAGDNNLSEEMVLALQDLVAEGAPNGSMIVAQFDPSGIGLETQRYRVRLAPGVADTSRHHRVHDVRFRPKSTPGVSKRSPTSSNGRSSHDTDGTMQYMLVLSGHGGGTSADFLHEGRQCAGCPLHGGAEGGAQRR